MADQRERERGTDPCPFCSTGHLTVNPSNGLRVCDRCGSIVRPTPSSPGRSGSDVYRLRKWQQRIRVSNATERNLAFALSELDRLATVNSLPRNVKESAYTIYRKVVSRNMVRGRSIEGIAAATVYAACRISGIPRTIDEIAETSGVGKKELGRTYRFIARELKLNLLPAKPQDYVTRYCEALSLSEKVQVKSKELLQKVTDTEMMSGLGPSGIAAGAVYISALICDEPRSQREVSQAADISEVTLRCRYKKMADRLGIRIEFA